MAQRAYELVSFKLFAALKHRRPTAKLGYAEYCLFAPQQRYLTYDQLKKQMYKVHRPHTASGYFLKVQYEATTDDDGLPDWLMHYTPGPKARTEYAAFMRQSGAEAAVALTLPTDADPQDLIATVTRTPSAVLPPPPVATRTSPGAAPTVREAVARPALGSDLPPGTTHVAFSDAGIHAARLDPLQAEAQTLVTAFYQRFHGLTQVTASPKELAHATALLAQHGTAKAHFLVAFAHQEAPETRYTPQVFGGILHYLPRALVAYDARAAQGTHATTQRAAADERTQREQHRAWEQQQQAGLRAALPPAELAALEEASRARLVAEGTPAYALRMGVRAAVDQVLAAQAGLPSFEAWRQMQEAGG
jgi:hypothetical protein